MTLREAIDKLFFVECGDYPLYLDNLFGEEQKEELEEVNEARTVFAESGLDLDEVLAKKKTRQANCVHEPIPFIKRTFFRCETDELPF